jgi:predicted ferric reductase
MNPESYFRWQALRRMMIWSLWALNLGIIVYFWAITSFPLWLDHTLPTGIFLGRLAGLLATFCALMQFVLMSRGIWLEPIFGLDRLARAHRLNGLLTIMLMLLHPLLLAWGYGTLENRDIIAQIVAFWNLPFVLWASAALLLFCFIVGFSLYILRKHLKFETWYFIHLATYAAIALLPWHQLTNGGTLTSNEFFRNYWILFYFLVALNMLIWRFGMPLYRYWRHGFTIEKIVAEVPRATSVYLAGKNMKDFHAKGGMFVLVRFLHKGLWWQEHPFTLSRLPNKKGIRLTIRQLGDFTNEIPALKPNTKVVVSGPYGAFTLDRARQKKILYIAGGIGITPIRSLIEEQASRAQPSDSILLYANRSHTDIALKDELDELAKRMPLQIHHILSDDPDAPEQGFIDENKLRQLVPLIQEYSIFLCGPPPMMKGVIGALRNMGVLKSEIHFEQFSLHIR